MKEIMNKNEQIKNIEQTIQSTQQTLKNWANQIGKYHARLKALSQQLTSLKGEIIMNENNTNNKLKGGTN